MSPVKACSANPLALLIASLCATAAFAQWPGGTWSNSCSNNTISAGVLQASCAFKVQVKQVNQVPDYLVEATEAAAQEVGNEILNHYIVIGLEKFSSWYRNRGFIGDATLYPLNELPAIPEASEEEENEDDEVDVDGDGVDMESAIGTEGVEASAAEESAAVAVDLDVAASVVDMIPGIGEVSLVATSLFFLGKSIYHIIEQAVYEDSYVTGYLSTAINYTAFCGSSTVNNNNGVLECGAWSGPQGSYLETCTNVAINGSVASALCKNGNYYQNGTGGTIFAGTNISTINTTFCASPVSLSNGNGALVCDSLASQPGLLGGSWALSCSPVILNGLAGSPLHMFGAYCGLQYGQLSYINVAMCDPSATMSNMNGLLICSALATTGPMVPPGGSWSESCSPISYINGTLYANCGLTFMNGTSKISKLNTSLCASASSVSNAYGVLTCEGASTNLPAGSWSATCTPSTYSAGFLIAYCGLPNAVASSVNMNLCADGATLLNDDGKMICSSISSSLPGGSWGATCSPLYYSEGLLVAICSTAVSTYGNIPLASYINTTYCVDGEVMNSNNILVCANGIASDMGLPGGSWSGSCAPLLWNTTDPDAVSLVAMCSSGDSSDNLSPTAINYNMCASSSNLLNDNGNLVCSDGGSPDYPGGSWLETCTPISFKGTILTATCSGDSSETTTLDTQYCAENGVSNSNGMLVCSPNSNTPGGSWMESCSFVSYTNGWLGAVCGLTNNAVSYVNMTLCGDGAELENKDGYLLCSSLAPGVPGGSWIESATPVSWDGKLLNAFTGVMSGSGSQLISTLDYAVVCATGSEVSNNDNGLMCTDISPSLPGGDWTGTCSAPDWSSDVGTLQAICSPLHYPTFINYSLCSPSSTVINEEGRLECTDYISLPGGNWIGTCSPYSWEGTVLTAYCDTGDENNNQITDLDYSACTGYNPLATGEGVAISNDSGELIC